MDSFVLKEQVPRRKSDSMDWGGGPSGLHLYRALGLALAISSAEDCLALDSNSYRKSIFPA